MNSLKVALLYPEQSSLGLSNLAVHFFTEQLSPKIDFDLFFMDSDKSFFQKRKVSSFDILLVSISYELSYRGMALFFHKEGIPILKKERESNHYPLIIGGGIAISINPAPTYDIFDISLIGEGEPMLTDLFHIFKTFSKPQIIDFASSLSYALTPDKQRAKFIRADDGAFGAHSTLSLHKYGNGFGNRFVVELNRSCTEKCYFCAASYVYKNYREADRKSVFQNVERAIDLGDGVALMGTSINNVSYIEELLEIITKNEVSLSISSVKTAYATEKFMNYLKKGGVKTVTLAIESADQKVRDRMHKPVNEK